MNLYIMRHGPAVERGHTDYPNDNDRPLTPEGKKKVSKIAAGLRTLEITLDAIFSSPLPRARRTAEIVAEALHPRCKFRLTEHLSPDADPAKLLHLLQQQKGAKNLLIVGHEPDLGNLVSLLLTGQPGLAVNFKKGGFCKLSLPALTLDGHATLEWWLPPKILAALG